MDKLFSDNRKLIPAVIQEEKTGEVLMLGYVNRQSYMLTDKTGFVWFWSRSKKRLWQKGETSGNKLAVRKVFTDCDSDTLLYIVKLVGKNVCHTGKKSCFSETL